MTLINEGQCYCKYVASTELVPIEAMVTDLSNSLPAGSAEKLRDVGPGKIKKRTHLVTYGIDLYQHRGITSLTRNTRINTIATTVERFDEDSKDSTRSQLLYDKLCRKYMPHL